MNNTNININEVRLSDETIKERLAFFNLNIFANNRIPNFKVVYTSLLLYSIQECKMGYNNINDIYDISLEILEKLNINVDYEKALDEMYLINKEEIKKLPNTYLLDNSITGLLVKLV